MCIDHTCSENCLGNKSAQKLKVFCLFCDQASNAKCFGITAAKVVSLISSKTTSTNIVFLCSKCHDKVSKLRNKNRSSLDAVHRRSTAPSVVRSTEPKRTSLNHVSTENPSTLNSSDTNLLTTINDKLTTIIYENNKLKEKENEKEKETAPIHTSKPELTELSTSEESGKKLLENIMHLHAKLDSRLPAAPKAHNIDHHSEIMTKLDLLLRKYDTLISTNDKKTGIASNSLFTPVNKSARTNPLDWTLQFNHSPSAASTSDNSDIYMLLNGFERNTWASLDHIREKIVENNILLTHIQSDMTQNARDHMSNATPLAASLSNVLSPLNQPHNSALTSAINMETINEIHDSCIEVKNKCDVINNKVDVLTESIALNCMTSLDLTNRETLVEQNQIVLNSNSIPVDRPLCENVQVSPFSSLSDVNNPEFTLPPSSQSENSGDANAAHDTIETCSSTHTNISTNQPKTRLNEFHLSKFGNNTTCQMILEYMSCNGVSNSLLENVKVSLLVPKQRDVATLSFVSFKLDVNNEVATIISNINFWPPTCILKNFIHKSKLIADLSSNLNFQMNCPPMQTARSRLTVIA